MAMLSHATSTGFNISFNQCWKSLRGENIAFPLQDKTDRHCTQPMSEIITPHLHVFNNLRLNGLSES